MKINKLYEIDCRIGLNQMIQDKQQVDCVITSPPYWSLRDYRIEPSIWDGDPNCEHNWNSSNEIIRINKSDWKTGNKISPEEKLHSYEKRKDNFCSKCNAWKGTFGLEPNFELYIKHLCDIYDLIWKVLKDYGTNWVNMGDGYSSGSTLTMQQRIELEKKSNTKLTKLERPKPRKIEGYKQKCLLMLPQRFAIEMINRGWILRNVLIWYKPNAMPSSAKDRFTVDFEYIYLFVKSSKTQYWINENTLQSVSKHPLGTKGIENIDWEWRECPKCDGTGIEHKECEDCEGEGWIYNNILQLVRCPECKGLGKIIQKKECKKCKGLGKIKYNFWRGRQYYFEQQFEAYDEPLNRWGGNRYSQHTLKHSKYIEQQNLGVSSGLRENKEIRPNPLGKNKRTVWCIPTQPNPEAHFATFPIKLVEPMIKAGCPKFVCSKCGKPREKIYDLEYKGATQHGSKTSKYYNSGTQGRLEWDKPAEREFKGYSDCSCNAKFIPGIVYDPFTGTGTTLKVANNLGRNWIGHEISKVYCEIFEKWNKNRSLRLDKFM